MSSIIKGLKKEGQIYSTGGGAGQSYRKFTPKSAGVSEGHADQQKKIFKKNGQPVGEVGIDRESSPGVGTYYMKHYDSGTDLSGYHSFKEAVDELKHYMRQRVAEEQAPMFTPENNSVQEALSETDVIRLGRPVRASMEDPIDVVYEYPIYINRKMIGQLSYSENFKQFYGSMGGKALPDMPSNIDGTDYNATNKFFHEFLDTSAGKYLLRFVNDQRPRSRASNPIDETDAKTHLQHVLKQNPKGSAAEKIILKSFLKTENPPEDIDQDEWIDSMRGYLIQNRQKLKNTFPELDFTDLDHMAQDLYVNHLYSKKQLEQVELKKESSIFKGLQTEDKAKAKEKLEKEINDLIKKIWTTEIPSIQDQGRYLVYSVNSGLEVDTNSLNDAIFSAEQLSKKSLDSPTLVYDRKTKFPVVAYKGSEDVWYKKDTSKFHEGYKAGVTGGAGLGIEKSPIEKVLEKPLAEGFAEAIKEIEELNKLAEKAYKQGNKERANSIVNQAAQLAEKLKLRYRKDKDGIAIAHRGVDEGKNTITKTLEEVWSKKYKQSIDCNNPKGFSQKAHCAGRKARQAGKHTKSKSVNK